MASVAEPDQIPSPERPAGNGPVRALAVVIALLLVGGLASLAIVEPRPDGGRPLTALAIAASAQEAASWRTMTMEMTTTVTAGKQRFGSTMRLQIDNERQIGSMTMRVDPGGAGPAGSGFTMVITRGFVAVDQASTSPEAGGRRWIGWRLPAQLQEQSSAATATGAQMLEQLTAAKGEPVVVGTERVRGVETTHYRVDIDLAKLAAEAAARAEAVGVTLPGSQLSESLPAQMDVWIDADNLVRATAFDTKVDSGPGVSMHARADYFGYGDPVDIEVPAESEVFFVSSMEELMSRATSAGG